MFVKVDVIQSICAVMPVVAAERSTRQAHLHDVVELAIAGVNLDLAIVEKVVCAADTRSNLVAPAEVHGGKALGIVRGLILRIEPDADVQGQIDD